MKALLIIDMQKGSFKPYALRHDALGIINRINKLSERFRQGGFLVIFVQHDGTRENCFLPNSVDWELLPELIRAPSDIMLSKIANDSFYHSALLEVLTHHQISEIFITGCATDFCVDSTVKSALNKDFRIIVVEDGHTTASRPFVDAETLIKHYNWMWSEMTPTKHKLCLAKAAAIKL